MPRRLCFLCISYEPGADGVGDYIRLLIDALPGDVTVTVIALHDAYVEEQVVEQQDGALVVRLPRCLGREGRYSAARTAVEHADPDWLSLHFVCWFFGPKGVVLSEAEALRRLTAGRCLQIMFHEPWMRPARPWSSAVSARNWILGRLQRWSIGRMVGMLRPALVHTSNRNYQHLFEGLGVAARLLPIFGTLPSTAPASWFELQDMAGASGTALPGSRDDWLLIGLFGAVRDTWDANTMLSELTLAAIRLGRRPALVQLGRAGPLGERMVSAAGDIEGLTVVRLGILPFARLMSLLPVLHVGLAHQPPADLGRSTTTAAMLEWGVPVIVPIAGRTLPDDPFVAHWQSMLIWPSDTMADALAAALVGEPSVRYHSDPRPAVAARLLAEMLEAGRGA